MFSMKLYSTNRYQRNMIQLLHLLGYNSPVHLVQNSQPKLLLMKDTMFLCSIFWRTFDYGVTSLVNHISNVSRFYLQCVVYS